METSADFERALRARYGIESDYGLAKLLGISRSAMSLHRSGGIRTFGEETGYRIAELLERDPAYVQACLLAERAEKPERKKVWQRVAKAFAGLLVITITTILLPTPSRAAMGAGGFDITLSSACNRNVLYIMRSLAGWLRRRLRAWGAIPTMRGRILAAALGSLLIAGTAAAGDPWSESDKAREGAYLALHVINWGQTRYAATHPDENYALNEVDPLLGEHPTTRRIDAYMLTSALLHVALADYLTSAQRDIFQNLTLGFKASAVAYNLDLGIKIDF